MVWRCSPVVSHPSTQIQAANGRKKSELSDFPRARRTFVSSGLPQEWLAEISTWIMTSLGDEYGCGKHQPFCDAEVRFHFVILKIGFTNWPKKPGTLVCLPLQWLSQEVSSAGARGVKECWKRRHVAQQGSTNHPEYPKHPMQCKKQHPPETR